MEILTAPSKLGWGAAAFQQALSKSGLAAPSLPLSSGVSALSMLAAEAAGTAGEGGQLNIL